ncbi:MAG: (d)CMP kinase [Candidatus Ornithomonoglobus sp.]
MAVRAIRGATTVKENTKECITQASIEMIDKIIKKNNLDTGDMIDILFTVTPDITAMFPAAAVRKMGITEVPLLDMAAPDVDGALEMCIRVIVHINTDLGNNEMKHVYLNGAKKLRPDIAAENRISVAIDGPAGAGKSSVAKAAAARLGYVYIDTGAMYRTVAVYAIENGIDIKAEPEKLVSRLGDIKIDIEYADGMQKMYLNGADVTSRIRENDASMGASAVAAIPEVRTRLVAMQQEMAKGGGVLMDGRDIATAVLPDAELKIYLTASVEERAMRRYREYIEKGTECDYETIKADVIKRDHDDMNRAVSPLRKAENAVLLDSSDLSFEETVDKILEMVKETEQK